MRTFRTAGPLAFSIQHLPLATIGLEIHAQLRTASKIFCGCSTAYGAPPNTNVCQVCLGYPGALPVLNRAAVELAARAAVALGCTFLLITDIMFDGARVWVYSGAVSLFTVGLWQLNPDGTRR